MGLTVAMYFRMLQELYELVVYDWRVAFDQDYLVKISKYVTVYFNYMHIILQSYLLSLITEQENPFLKDVQTFYVCL